MAIGERIRFFRNLKGMTQKYLGIQVGFPERTADIRMAQYESGSRTPKSELTNNLAEVFDVSTMALTVPNIESYNGLMHTLFAVEDLYGLKITKNDGEICLHLDKGMGANYITMFEMFSSRLYENGIYCVIETFDPMINTELIARVLPQKHTPLNIVHLNAQNLGEKNINENDAFLFDVVEKELEVITHTSRLNLAVALTDAKQMKKLRKRVNLLSAGFSALGLILTLLAVLIGFTTAFNEFWVFLVWGLSFGGLLTLILCTMPKNYKFSFEHFLRERELLESIEENTEE